VIEARRCAERIYPGISAAWVRTGVTRTAAVRYLEKAGARRKCSFCGKLWHKVEYIMAKRRAGAEIAICGDCIRRLYRIIAEDSKEDPSSSAAEDR
jgi:hypothetical protein